MFSVDPMTAAFALGNISLISLRFLFTTILAGVRSHFGSEDFVVSPRREVRWTSLGSAAVL